MTDEIKILVVEDDEQLQRMLQSLLVQVNYQVLSATSGKEALERLRTHDVSAVLLDLGLPDADGKEIITKAHEISNAPILVISARGSEKEKIAALDMGANDYLAKPFDAGELLARIRVALRPRRRAFGAASDVGRPKLMLDFDTRRATVDGRAVALSRKEMELVRILASSNGEVVPHEKIVEQIWGPGADSDQMNLRVLVWQVRRKIEPNLTAPQYLIAEAGEGYRLKLD